MNFLRNLFGLPRGLTSEEHEIITNMWRLVSQEKFKLFLVQSNTALFDDKKLLATQQRMVELLENEYKTTVSQTLSRLGYPPGSNLSVNIKTGKVYGNRTSKGTERQPVSQGSN